MSEPRTLYTNQSLPQDHEPRTYTPAPDMSEPATWQAVIGQLPLPSIQLDSIMASDARVVKDFSKKFYNSLGSVPNLCSVV
ncbi:hypothetical protein Tco_0474866 [Tanacetum coccineum]